MRGFGVLAIAATLATILAGLVGSSPAEANHMAGAVYRGTIEGGGTISFTLTEDGSGITGFGVGNMRGPGCTIPFFVVAYTVPLSITNHSFGTSSTDYTFTGSFQAPNAASGTVRVRDPGRPFCLPGTQNWTATGAVPTATASATVAATVTGTPATATPTRTSTPTRTRTSTATVLATTTATPTSATPTRTASPTRTQNLTATATLSPDPGQITIPDNGVASPYPANRQVAGLDGTITKVTVSLNGRAIRTRTISTCCSSAPVDKASY